MKFSKIFHIGVKFGSMIDRMNDEFAHEAKNADVRVRTDCRWFAGLNDMYIVPAAHM